MFLYSRNGFFKGRPVFLDPRFVAGQGFVEAIGRLHPLPQRLMGKPDLTHGPAVGPNSVGVKKSLQRFVIRAVPA